MYTTPAEIRADVQRMIDLSDSRGGGVILAPSSSIMANTPTENVLAFYEACVNQDGDRITSGKRVETQAELREFMNSER
jgi:uroporphyrinogen-III decarboxylase